MDCARARTYIECYVDGELDPVTGADVEKHLHQCPTCQRARDRLIAFRALIRDGVPYRVPPYRLSR
jgi:predicted anti-sigma-YlaC factor YlaD